MRTASWIPYTACTVLGAVLGAGGALVYQSLHRSSVPVEQPVSQVAPVRESVPEPVAPPVPVPVLPPAPASAVVQAVPPPAVQFRPATPPLLSEGGAIDAYLADTREYAASFQSGVFLQGRIPEFAFNYFFPSKEQEAEAQEENNKFVNEGVDAWSTDMEYKLQAFFQG